MRVDLSRWVRTSARQFELIPDPDSGLEKWDSRRHGQVCVRVTPAGKAPTHCQHGPFILKERLHWEPADTGGPFLGSPCTERGSCSCPRRGAWTLRASRGGWPGASLMGTDSPGSVRKLPPCARTYRRLRKGARPGDGNSPPSGEGTHQGDGALPAQGLTLVNRFHRAHTVVLHFFK